MANILKDKTAVSRKIKIVGVPMDLGQKLRGVDMGPSAVRYAGLRKRLKNLGYEVHDEGNIRVAIRDNIPHEKQVNYLPSIVETLENVYNEASKIISEGAFPIFIGGDHSISIGTIGGVTSNPKHNYGVIWIDAHGDFNTFETSPSGNIHGMPLAASVGLGAEDLIYIGRKERKVDPKNVVMIGMRDLDEGEKELIRKSGVHIYTMRSIDELGMAEVVRRALDDLKNVDRIHVSLDVDVIDPNIAPGVGTPVPGGITYREAHLLMEMLSDSNKVCSFDICEINPIFDVENRSAKMAVELAASLLGKSII
ncbi:MAG: arginase [Promethearchaeota archaeon]